MMNSRRKFNHCTGFFLMDAVTGIVVALAILVALTVSVQRYRHASRRLADQRAAVHLAERVLTDLQAGRPPTLEQDGLKAKMLEVQQPAATPGGRWVEVRVEGAAASFALVGLVPVRGKEGPP